MTRKPKDARPNGVILTNLKRLYRLHSYQKNTSESTSALRGCFVPFIRTRKDEPRPLPMKLGQFALFVGTKLDRKRSMISVRKTMRLMDTSLKKTPLRLCK